MSAGDFLHDVALKDIAFLDVVELLNGHTAFVVLRDLLDGVLEALQGADDTVIDDTCASRVTLPSLT